MNLHMKLNYKVNPLLKASSIIFVQTSEISDMETLQKIILTQ